MATSPGRWSLYLLLLLLSTTFQCNAYKDSNIYPWGDNPNTHFKMYWKDASNVLQDLQQFQALYIQVHGCVWSECQVDNFDDDGENHDGDEQWYETRTDTFCANAVYSLYGIKKNNFKLVNTCSKGTYINSFFTYGGADTLASALELNINTNDGNRYSQVDDDTYGTSNSDCVEVENYGRELSDSDEDDDDEDKDGSSQSYVQSVATTMGCAASATSKYNKFVTAGFSDAYCSGRNFLETLDTLKSYNKAMRKVSCTRIWSLNDGGSSYNNNNNDDDGNDDDDDGNNRDLLQQEEEQEHRHLSNDNQNYQRVYTSVAEQLLYNSWACDLSLYPNQCPDPYGLKRKYLNVMKSAANGQPIGFAVWNARVRKPIQIITWLLFLVGAYLLVFAYTIRNKDYIKSNGGGVRGFVALVARDAMAAGVKLKEAIQKAKARHDKRKERRKGEITGRGGSGGKDRNGEWKGSWAALFGKKKKKSSKKKSKKHKDKLRRSNSGREMDREVVDTFVDEESVEAASVYTELTDDYKSNPSGGSSRYSSNKNYKAAEAAFAAAAQFDLEQQQQYPPSNRRHHPSILPAASHGSQKSSQKSSRRAKSTGRSRSTGRGGSSRRSSTRRRSRSPSGSSMERSQSLPRRTQDPSPTRTSNRRAPRSKSPQSRVFV